jgi:hypothetical protein
MIYENKQAAEKAADEFAMEKYQAGYMIRKRTVLREVCISYLKSHYEGDWSVKGFPFKDLPQVEKDQLVWVREINTQEWLPRYATGDFADSGKILCYCDGRTSTTDYSDPISWNYYSLTDPNQTEGEIDPIEGEIDPIEEELPQVKKDQLVWVRDKIYGAWEKRVATGKFDKYGSICCYYRGRTSSESMDDDFCTWRYYSLTDPEEDLPQTEDLPQVEKDQLVWVRNWGDAEWKERFATGEFDEQGWICCYSEGKTSCASDYDDFCAWKYYSLTDPEEDLPQTEDLPHVEKDQLVWVRDLNTQEWLPRYATGKFEKNGRICCYFDGRTSCECTYGEYWVWNYYSLTDPIEGDLPQIEKNQVVWVRNWEDVKWVKRFATGKFDEKGRIFCYCDGRVSDTSGYKPSITWACYSLTDPNQTEEEIDPIERDLPQVERDQLVWVRNEEELDWEKRFATGKFNEQGGVYCYYHGKTSCASDYDDFCAWKYYSLTDPYK